MNSLQIREESLFERISALIEEARKRVKTAIDTTMVYTYYGIGQYIVDDEQQGERIDLLDCCDTRSIKKRRKGLLPALHRQQALLDA